MRAVRASHPDLAADVECAHQTPRRVLIHKANHTPSRGLKVVARGAGYQINSGRQRPAGTTICIREVKLKHERGEIWSLGLQI